MRKVTMLCMLLIWTLSLVQSEPIIPPVEGSEDIEILRVQYIASNLNNEFIVIFNSGKTTVDISGWAVFDYYYNTYRILPPQQRADETAWRHICRIPYGYSLKPYHWLRICTGFGQNNELYVYRNLREQWLADDGDTVYLVDCYNNIIDEYSW